MANGGRAAAVVSAPAARPEAAQPTCRTLNAVASTPAWTRRRRVSVSSLTPSTAASHSPNERASGPTTCRNDDADRMDPPLPRR